MYCMRSLHFVSCSRCRIFYEDTFLFAQYSTDGTLETCSSLVYWFIVELWWTGVMCNFLQHWDFHNAAVEKGLTPSQDFKMKDDKEKWQISAFKVVISPKLFPNKQTLLHAAVGHQ